MAENRTALIERVALERLRAAYSAKKRISRSDTLRRAVTFYSGSAPGWVYFPQRDAIAAAPTYVAPFWLFDPAIGRREADNLRPPIEMEPLP